MTSMIPSNCALLQLLIIYTFVSNACCLSSVKPVLSCVDPILGPVAYSTLSRRSILRKCVVGLIVGTSTIFSTEEEASASYSAYAAREKDWSERSKSGAIKYSTAADLRAQIRQMVPNIDSSKIFCPNGVSSNVSPLMENKCGERMASPSVFGRSEDAVGNSIPGFRGEYKVSSPEATIDVIRDSGGFPKYYTK